MTEKQWTNIKVWNPIVELWYCYLNIRDKTVYIWHLLFLQKLGVNCIELMSCK